MVRVGGAEADGAAASPVGLVAPDSSFSLSFPCPDPVPGRAGAAVHLACESRSDAESSHTLPVAVSITTIAPGSFSGAYRPGRGTTKPRTAPIASPATSPSKSQTKSRLLIPTVLQGGTVGVPGQSRRKAEAQIFFQPSQPSRRSYVPSGLLRFGIDSTSGFEETRTAQPATGSLSVCSQNRDPKAAGAAPSTTRDAYAPRRRRRRRRGAQFAQLLRGSERQNCLSAAALGR